MNYIKILKSSGLKATLQRLSILEIIDTKGHIKIDDLYQEMHKINPKISLATVYKNILTMMGKSVVLEVPIIGGKSYYELKKEDHIHLICNICNNIKDKDINNLNLNVNELSNNFIISHSQLNIYGTCPECKA
ncbi:Peroxide stress regulator; Ferric uptake regulation protein; Fe2+/Zn2+ uptake regulation proteins [hydrothermal vent metagenome]|uniref:Peroxide stress regulator Ferric uptake regulation protein Fe2+/Zn2+ uptake regulation proteins n=1 Tax=hydrothermal vent metagenome TaxID=652676 RepID=A0A1W1C5N1_9ZZZZ